MKASYYLQVVTTLLHAPLARSGLDCEASFGRDRLLDPHIVIPVEHQPRSHRRPKLRPAVLTVSCGMMLTFDQTYFRSSVQHVVARWGSTVKVLFRGGLQWLPIIAARRCIFSSSQDLTAHFTAQLWRVWVRFVYGANSRDVTLKIYTKFEPAPDVHTGGTNSATQGPLYAVGDQVLSALLVLPSAWGQQPAHADHLRRCLRLSLPSRRFIWAEVHPIIISYIRSRSDV